MSPGPPAGPRQAGPRAGPPPRQLGEGAGRGRRGRAAGGSGERGGPGRSSSAVGCSVCSLRARPPRGGRWTPASESARRGSKLCPHVGAHPCPCMLAGVGNFFAPSLPPPLLHPRKRGSLEGVKFWVKDGQREGGTTWAFEGRPYTVMCRAGIGKILDPWSPPSPSSFSGIPQEVRSPTRSPSLPPSQTCGTQGPRSLFPKTFSPGGIWTISLGNRNKNRALHTDSRADKLAFKRERDTDLL